MPAATTNREIVRLSVSAFLALVAEPLFLLADAAIVGHLGTAQLGGLGIAIAVVGGLVSLCIFLTYGTTASVSRLVGAGQTRAALAQGVDGIWLAVVVGAAISALGIPLSPAIVGWFGAEPDVSAYAVTYLQIALAGTIPMLMVLASIGVLRGLRDLRTPLWVAAVGSAANAVLNWVLVYPVGWGVAGSALGTLIVQVGSAAVLVGVVVKRARTAGAPLAPDAPGIRRAAGVGVPLLVRTLMLRVVLFTMTFAAARFGTAEVATMQLALAIWTFLAFSLDALAITAQTLVGHELGVGDRARVRSMTTMLVRWGLWLGVGTGLLLFAMTPWLGRAFTSDEAVLALLGPVLIVAALGQPVAGVVFTLDGILIGAGDGRYLAVAQTIVAVAFAALAWWAVAGPGTLTALWIAFVVGFMGTRAVLLLARSRGEAWMRVGASTSEPVVE